MSAFRIDTREGSCDFTRLPDLIMWSHMLLPALQIPLAFFMLPVRLISDARELAYKRHPRTRLYKQSANISNIGNLV